MLEIKNVSYAYPNKHVLNNVSLSLQKKEVVAIIGGSGVGKTTLFHLIAGILKLQDGEIVVNGDLNYFENISYMLQKDMLFEHKTILENIALPLIIQKMDKKLARKEALEKLTAIGLEDVKDYYPKQLSGGMRQRIAFLRTYMFKRPIFLLDEAFSALDAHTRMSMHQFYLELHDRLDLSSLLITHDIDEAIMLSDRIYVMGNTPGEIVLELKLEKTKRYDRDFLTSQQFMEYKKILLNKLGL